MKKIIIIISLLLLVIDISIIYSCIELYQRNKKENDNFVAQYNNYDVLKNRSENYETSTLFLWYLLRDKKVTPQFISRFFVLYNHVQSDSVCFNNFNNIELKTINESTYCLYVLSFSGDQYIFLNNELIGYSSSYDLWYNEKRVEKKRHLQMNKILKEEFNFQGFRDITYHTLQLSNNILDDIVIAVDQ